jgi:hypothetical protein
MRKPPRKLSERAMVVPVIRFDGVGVRRVSAEPTLGERRPPIFQPFKVHPAKKCVMLLRVLANHRLATGARATRKWTDRRNLLFTASPNSWSLFAARPFRPNSFDLNSNIEAFSEPTSFYAAPSFFRRPSSVRAQSRQSTCLGPLPRALSIRDRHRLLARRSTAGGNLCPLQRRCGGD